MVGDTMVLRDGGDSGIGGIPAGLLRLLAFTLRGNDCPREMH